MPPADGGGSVRVPKNRSRTTRARMRGFRPVPIGSVGLTARNTRDTFRKVTICPKADTVRQRRSYTSNVPSSFASRPAPAHSPMGRYPNPAPSRTPPLRERPRRKVRALSIVRNSGYATHERMQCPGGAARLGTTPTGEAFPEAVGMQAFSVSAFRRAAPAYGEIPSRKRRLGQPRKRRLKKRPRPENDDAPHRARDPAAPRNAGTVRQVRKAALPPRTLRPQACPYKTVAHENRMFPFTAVRKNRPVFRRA